jgi:hypothetical protein
LEKKVWDTYVLGSPELPTVGSVGHYFRKCKPCAFIHKKGCANGTECQFCHLCEPGEKRRRQQGLLEKRRRQQRCRRGAAIARGEQGTQAEQGHMQEFEEYAEEGYIGALSVTKAPRIAAPRSSSCDDAPKDGHAALPVASKAARIAAPGGRSSSSKEEEQWFSI